MVAELLSVFPPAETLILIKDFLHLLGKVRCAYYEFEYPQRLEIERGYKERASVVLEEIRKTTLRKFEQVTSNGEAGIRFSNQFATVVIILEDDELTTARNESDWYPSPEPIY